MKKNISTMLSLVSMIALSLSVTGCGTDEEEGFEQFSEISTNSAIFVYQHLDSLSCNATANNSQAGISLELIEYSELYKDCADYNRVNNPSAAFDAKNVCVEYDMGMSSSGTCVIGATISSDYYYGTYQAPAREQGEELINR